MAIRNAFAVVATADLDRARDWWVRLLGRQPDRVPMPSDVEWDLPDGGVLQLVDDAERAGSSSVTLAVDDVDAELSAVATRGIDGVPAAETVPSGQFRLAMLADPDGNQVVVVQQLTD